MKRREFGRLLPASVLLASSSAAMAGDDCKNPDPLTFELFEEFMWDHVTFAADRQAESMAMTVKWDTEASCRKAYQNMDGGSWEAAMRSNFERCMKDGIDPREMEDQPYYFFYFYQCAQRSGKHAARLAGPSSKDGVLVITQEIYTEALLYVKGLMERVDQKSGVSVRYQACA